MSGSVTYDGVTFVRAACAGMTKAEFIRKHQCFWPGKDSRSRNKMLAEAYDLVAPPAAEKEE